MAHNPSPIEDLSGIPDSCLVAFGSRIRSIRRTTKQARSAAVAELRLQAGLNHAGHCIELAYSPSTGSVGMRWENDGFAFRAVNIADPGYRRSGIEDWISVGTAAPK